VSPTGTDKWQFTFSPHLAVLVLYMRLPMQHILVWESALFQFLHIGICLHLCWKVCITILHLVVIGCTFLRLLHRWRTNRMWWDDYSTVLPLVIDVAYVIFMWWKFRGGGKLTYPFRARSIWINIFSFSGLASQKSEGFIYSALFFASICWTIIWWLLYFLLIAQAHWVFEFTLQGIAV
jgi:hypothetical protein